jgi:pimeloyl-ACP methyl ester carboxylesterase
MRPAWKILIAFFVVLAALLAINTVVIGSETKPAGVTAEGGEIVELDSVDMQIVDEPASGRGPEGAPIVLLHCYACSLHWWDEFVPLVNEGHRVIRFDLIGFGGSQKPGSGYSMDDQARAVAESLNRLGVEGAVVVGHSMGGLVAAAVAQNSSELVDRVALIGTASSISDDASLPFADRLLHTPVIGEALWRLAPDSVIKDGYSSAFAPGFDFEAAFEDPDQVVLDHEAMTYTSSDQSESESGEFTDEATVAARLTDAAVPLMAILGSEDQIVDNEPTAAAYGGVPGAEVQVIDGVGHSPQLENPKKTADLILRFAEDAPAPIEPEPAPKPKPKAEKKKLERIPGIKEQLEQAKGSGKGNGSRKGSKAGKRGSD